MILDIDLWMDQLLARLQAAFGPRLLFVGIQGSYRRGEATEHSDIDAVIVLDELTPRDLLDYKALLAGLPHRELVCGFVSGRAELAGWDRADLFQFYHDTRPLLGRLEDILPPIGPEDLRRAVRLGACNLYHMACHNLLHENDPAILDALGKSAFFTLQAKCFLETGNYWESRALLAPALSGEDRAILELRQDVAEAAGDQARFEALSLRLIAWAGALIRALNEA